MKICVTGGAGFIGSNIVKRLLSDGHAVVVVDNLSTGRMENISEFSANPDFEFIEASIDDAEKMKEVMNGVDFVFHHAAFVDVAGSIKDPKTTYDTNVAGTLNVLAASAEAGVKKIIFASSCAIYEDSKAAVKEDADIDAQSPYAISKILGETMINNFCKERGLRAVVLRYFNVYGPNQNVNSGYTAVIPKFIHRAMAVEQLQIHGDGEQTRDFVFVDDVVDANILAMQSGEVSGGEVFNIGSGRATNINQLAEKIIELTKSESTTARVEQREDNRMHSLADISAAKDVLKFHPKHSIDDGLRKTIEWFKSQK